MKSNTNLLLIIIGLFIAGVGFFAGMKYQEMSRVGQARAQFGQGARNGQMPGRGGNGFRPVSGQIISADDKSITVKLADGSSKIVLLSETTLINKSTDGAKADLQVGVQVAVFGIDNTDGSVTAQNVQLNPQVRVMPTGQK